MLSTASTNMQKELYSNRTVLVSVSLFFLYWISTLITTPNLSNWILENTLVIIFLLVLVATQSRFRFSDASYLLIFFYLILHVYGAKFTYAENPFGYWLKDAFDLGRNHYDRIVHFSFGLLLAYPMRDFFRNHFGWPSWVCWVLPAEITLSFSGMYELIEWLVAQVLFPEQGADYLGSQGDVWDAQKDMALAFSGAVLTMLLSALFRPWVRKNS